jgi:hypothetical protein
VSFLKSQSNQSVYVWQELQVEIKQCDEDCDENCGASDSDSCDEDCGINGEDDDGGASDSDSTQPLYESDFE